MPENDNVVHAEPQKEFFIDMLTRDIGLMECILDLKCLTLNTLKPSLFARQVGISNLTASPRKRGPHS